MKILIVPKTYQGKTVPYPVQKNGKQASAIVYISPVGFACKTLYKVPRANLDPQISDLPLDSCEVVRIDRGYVNTAVFNHWLTNTFLTHLKKMRAEYNYYGKSVLILDGFVCHINALDQINLEDENLIMLQTLDVGRVRPNEEVFV